MADSRQGISTPYKGDAELDLICEIYYDKIKVGQGRGKPRREAQKVAYENLMMRMSVSEFVVCFGNVEDFHTCMCCYERIHDTRKTSHNGATLLRWAVD
jgi:hypothetical protein